jgi:hypothetical protein
MPIQPQNLPYSKSLRSEFLTSKDLLKLLKECVAETDRFSLSAEWSSGHVAENISDESDLDGIEDPGHISKMTMLATMTDGTKVFFFPVTNSFQPQVSGERGLAAERARSLAAKWENLPVRLRKLQMTRRALTVGLFALWIGIAWASIVSVDNVPAIAIVPVFGIAAAIAWLLSLLLPGKKFNSWRGATILDNPDEWWKDWRAWLPISGTAASIAVAVLGIILK